MGRIDGTNWRDDWWTTNQREKETTRIGASPGRQGQGRRKQSSDDVQTRQRIKSTKPPDPFCNYKIKSEVKWSENLPQQTSPRRTSDSNELSTKTTQERNGRIKNTIKEQRETNKIKNGRRRQKEQGPPSVVLEVSSWCLIRGGAMACGHECDWRVNDHHQPLRPKKISKLGNFA
jgi:hypothetical protein